MESSVRPPSIHRAAPEYARPQARSSSSQLLLRRDLTRRQDSLFTPAYASHGLPVATDHVGRPTVDNVVLAHNHRNTLRSCYCADVSAAPHSGGTRDQPDHRFDDVSDHAPSAG